MASTSTEDRKRPNQVVGKRIVAVLMAICSVTGTLVTDTAVAEDECVHKAAAFDGIRPLTYQTVSANPGKKVHIFRHFEDVCRLSSHVACQAPYIVQGDIVALAKTCGSRAFVQHIGTKSITTGWVETSSLKPWAPPQEDEIRSVSGGSAAATRHEQFRLTGGKGQPVCEAYLQRLNTTLFDSPSYCGRPESSAVPGFERLNRQYLTASEVNQISETGIPERFRLSTWRYDPPLDVDNDGRPDNVLIWNLDDPQEPHCGLLLSGQMGTDIGFQVALIMNADKTTLNLERTLAVFGDFDQRTAQPYNILYGNKKPPFVYDFPAYGYSYSLFRYRGKTYFDTFLRDTDKIHNPLSTPGELRVFINEAHRTHLVCALSERPIARRK